MDGLPNPARVQVAGNPFPAIDGMVVGGMNVGASVVHQPSLGDHLGVDATAWILREEIGTAEMPNRRASSVTRRLDPRANGGPARPLDRGSQGVEMGNRRFTIAIDGPAAAGKSTVGEIVARRLDAVFFDTGILYRALAALALDRDVSPSDGRALADMASEMTVEVQRYKGSRQEESRIVVDGQDLTSKLRSPEVDRIVSEVSAHAEVRSALISVQRDIGNAGAIVMAGRDIGTIVIPDATLKIFLRATPRVRAERRYAQNKSTEQCQTFDTVLDAVMRRDELDSSRDIAPLRPACDAIIIDSDALSIDEVAERIVVEAERRLSTETHE